MGSGECALEVPRLCRGACPKRENAKLPPHAARARYCRKRCVAEWRLRIWVGGVRPSFPQPRLGEFNLSDLPQACFAKYFPATFNTLNSNGEVMQLRDDQSVALK